MVIPRPRPWNIGELQLVLDHFEASMEELLALLPGRTRGAIECVKIGITRFHEGKLIKGFLSPLLEERMKKLFPKDEPKNGPKDDR
jgi:hypothetical protein